MKVHQLVTSLASGDAVSNHALVLRDLFRREGFESEIFAEYVTEETRETSRNLNSFLKEDSPNVILMAHYSIASSSMVALPEYKSRKILVYHNVTPYTYFIDIYPLMAFHCLRGRTDLPKIAHCVECGIAFSHFSERDLREAGISRTEIFPLMQDLSRLALPPDRAVLRAAAGSRERRILVVGRVAPNKKVEEAIKIVSLLHRTRLIVAGSHVGCEPYYYALLDLAKRLHVSCDFTGHISQEEMNALYRTADLMLVVSDHEGFCVPLLEAYHFGVPVIAYSAGAIPETAGGAAILYDRREPAAVAGMVRRVMENEDLRDRLRNAGKSVLERYRNYPYRETLLRIVQEVYDRTSRT